MEHGRKCSGCAWRRPKKSFRPVELAYSLNDISNDAFGASASAEIFGANLPQFAHCYVHKNFGAIADLKVVPTFPDGTRYSELAMVYMVAYILGMLTRYFPTHWTSLIQGENGDELWPAINRAQQLAETVFPELIVEFVFDALAQRNAAGATTS